MFWLIAIVLIIVSIIVGLFTEIFMFWLIAIVLIIVLVIVGFFNSVATDIKKEKAALESLIADKRLMGARIFNKRIQTPIAVANNGNIGFFKDWIKVFNIKDVNGFEILVGKKNEPASVIGTLLGIDGPINVESISLLFKMNDFNNPVIKIPLLSDGGGIGESLLEEITELISTLEYLEKNIKT